METFWLLLMALIGVFLTAYAHYRLPFHTSGRVNRIVLRVVLALAAVGVGTVAATGYIQMSLVQGVLSFVAGVGMAHLPAAGILFFKRLRSVRH